MHAEYVGGYRKLRYVDSASECLSTRHARPGLFFDIICRTTCVTVQPSNIAVLSGVDLLSNSALLSNIALLSSIDLLLA